MSNYVVSVLRKEDDSLYNEVIFNKLSLEEALAKFFDYYKESTSKYYFQLRRYLGNGKYGKALLAQSR